MNNKIQQNIVLADFSTFKIGGEAEYFIEAKTKEDLEGALLWAKENEKELRFLGGGSNVLINSDKISGLVVRFGNREIINRGERLECGAGASLNQALREAQNNSLSGLEWVAGIPGATIGGAIYGNAGAFNESISNIIETVDALDLKNNRFSLFSNKDCEFAYRDSFFKRNNSFVIWSAVLKMKKDKSPDIQKRIEANLKYRESHQPRLPSAGSVFKNVSLSDLKKGNPYLADKAKELGLVKDGVVGAGWLIDQAGFKGKKIGDAKVSLEHANFIINTGKASANDVVMLISYLKQQIRDRFKVQLREEIQYFGF